MAKYSGKIGFYTTVETSPGIWEEQIVEKPYHGDLVRNIKRYQTTNEVSDNISLSNNISIVADMYAYSNFDKIKYATYLNAKWKVESIEVERPRLILNIGGVYNE